jgi:eukaryotic-like serine/threonine-protein kinase
MRVSDRGQTRCESRGRLSSGMRIGPYQITDFIGAGGMGEVYRAHDTNLNRVVALKLLPVEFAADRERLSRFEDEARAVSSLSHPAIVTIYDAGQIGSQPYISMELVEGATLREILKSGAIPLRRSLRIAGQVSEGLAKAHEAGLVHRDLKPENVKVSVDGFVKILDFGLAKRVAADAAAETLASAPTAVFTSPGVILGTPAYMSPEQASGGRVEFPSDQFSFGAVLYEMLTGRHPFERPTMAETLSAIIREDAPRIADVNPAVPPPVRWIVERCLAKAPEERYALTRDLARDLASARDHLSELLGSRRQRPTKRAAGEVSLAVLPVEEFSNDPQLAPLADAMTDILIAELTQCEGIRVVSRASSMLYKGRRLSLPDLADELDVEWIVLGSLMQAGTEIRITIELVDASSDENRWAHSYTRSSRRVLSMQSEVAAAVAEAVNRVLTPKAVTHKQGENSAAVRRGAVSAHRAMETA